MNYNRNLNEGELDYIIRICSLKEEIGTWSDVAYLLNKNLGKNYDESAYRKKFKKHLFGCETEFNEEPVDEDCGLETIDEENPFQKMYKERVKIQDANREYRKTLRTEARIEALKEALREDNCRYNPNVLPYSGEDYQKEKEAVLCIGDWHCGDWVQNFYNEFNLNILTERVSALTQKTIKFCQRNNVTTLNVVNLSDLINNSIHVTTRVQNEFDAITQVKEVSRLLYKMLITLANNIPQITYRSVVDNHSRINMDAKEHIEKESFVKLIDWWLEDKIAFYNEEYAVKIKNPILMKFDNIDDNIGYFKINGKNIFFTHGHLGSQSSVVSDLTLATRIVADVVILGHWHKEQKISYQGAKIFYNGSAKGVDSYSLKKRLFDHPAQTLLIFDEEDVVDISLSLG